MNWDQLEGELAALRGWVVENELEILELHHRISVGHDRLRAAEEATPPDDDAIAAIRGRLKELTLKVEDTDQLAWRLLAVRSARVLKDQLGDDVGITLTSKRHGVAIHVNG